METRLNKRLGDRLIGLALFAVALIAYIYTLAPTLLDGDAALFQYIGSVLGVTYPTGFPLYLLLSRLWTELLPLGHPAWQMNLFSAVAAALTAPMLYAVARRVTTHRLAGLMAVGLYLTLPTFWRWSTEARIYTLNILLLTVILWLGVIGWDNPAPQKGWRGSIYRHRYALAAFLFGLQLTGHSTTILLLPGLALLFWFDYRAKNRAYPAHRRNWVGLALLTALPLTLYFYIPLRANAFIQTYGFDIAVAKGLIPDYYRPGLAGALRYFTAADFTGGVTTNWGQVPADFVNVYLGQLLPTDFRCCYPLLLTLFIAGLLTALFWPRVRAMAWPLLLIAVTPIPFVLAYGQGEQNAFLLTANLALVLIAGLAFGFIFNLIQQRLKHWALRNLIMVLIFIPFWIIPYRHAAFSINWLTNKWDTAAYDYWNDILSHPLEEGAVIMADWGDLTSMWYMQHIEDRRPDLLGAYPPTEAVAAEWLAAGKPVYIAGPTLEGWDAGVEGRYTVVSWGRLVRVAPPGTNAAELTPALTYPQGITFNNALTLRSAEYQTETRPADTLYVDLVWDVLNNLPADTRYSIRLMDGDRIVAQKDDTLRSGWFPLDYLPAGEQVVGAYPLEIPPGTQPDTYLLQLVVYTKSQGEWNFGSGGASVLTLSPIEVAFAPAAEAPGAIRFADVLSLDDYDFSVKRVGQGKGVALTVLLRALSNPQENYTLLVELVDRSGEVWRSWHQPLTTTAWQINQQVRYQVDIVYPAAAPVEDESLQVQISLLTPEGKRLDVRRGWMPIGPSLNLGGPLTIAKENRTYSPPEAQQDFDANFDDKARLVGFDAPLEMQLGAQSSLPMTLYWQGLGDMDTSYTVFAHLVDEAGQVRAQQDKIPGAGSKQPTTAWAVDEYITDPLDISLPPDLLPGVYRVVIGLYNPQTGIRLRHLASTGEVIGDSVTIHTINVNIPSE